MGGARPHFSPTYRVPSGTSRAKSEVVFSDLFRRKLRDGRSRKDRAERGRHHAKGTRYVGELFGRPVGSISCHSVSRGHIGLQARQSDDLLVTHKLTCD